MLKSAVGNTILMMSPGSNQLIGFARLAGFIASDKEHSSSVYRRYERLAARNLLYIQSELQELENHLDIFDQKDARRSVDSLGLALDWPLEQHEAQTHLDPHESERQVLVRELRAKIAEYRQLRSVWNNQDATDFGSRTGAAA